MVVALVVTATALLSAFLCGLYLPLARRWQFVDRPGARSSHTHPTPHGGGAPLQLAFALGVLLAAWCFGAWDNAFVLVLAVALLLTCLGIVDDLRNLSVRLRFSVYTVLCLGVSAMLLPRVMPTEVLLAAGLLGLTAFFMLWFINLFNFMDGIDGIASVQTIFACASAGLMSVDGGSSGYGLFCGLFAASHCGFLIWNWPPARLFMGDSGSVSSGFLIAAMTLLGAVTGQLSPLCWIILMAVFISDASWTLLFRLWTGQVVTQAHREHAYQRLSRHWGSHLRVDALLMAINLLWLLPLAWLAQLWPGHGLFLVILAYLPLLAGMAKIRRFT